MGELYSYDFLENADPDVLRDAALDMKFKLDEITGGTGSDDFGMKTQLFLRTVAVGQLHGKSQTSVTPMVSRLCTALINGVVRREALFTALTVQKRTDADHPDIKIVDVQMCSLRKTLNTIGIEIETIWGLGFQLKSPKVLRQMIETFADSGQLPQDCVPIIKKVKPPATDAQKLRAVKLWRAGMKTSEIALAVGVTVNQLFGIISKAKKLDPSLRRARGAQKSS